MLREDLEEPEELLRRPGPGRPSWLRSQRQTPSRTRDAEVRPLPELLEVLEEQDGLLLRQEAQEGCGTRRPRSPMMPASAIAGAAACHRRWPTSQVLERLEAPEADLRLTGRAVEPKWRQMQLRGTGGHEWIDEWLDVWVGEWMDRPMSQWGTGIHVHAADIMETRSQSTPWRATRTQEFTSGADSCSCSSPSSALL